MSQEPAYLPAIPTPTGDRVIRRPQHVLAIAPTHEFVACNWRGTRFGVPRRVRVAEAVEDVERGSPRLWRSVRPVIRDLLVELAEDPRLVWHRDGSVSLAHSE